MLDCAILTYKVCRLDPIVLITCHVKLCQYVARFSDLEYFHVGGIRVVNLDDISIGLQIGSSSLTVFDRYSTPINSRNLLSTFRMILLSSSGEKDARNASLLPAAVGDSGSVWPAELMDDTAPLWPIIVPSFAVVSWSTMSDFSIMRGFFRNKSASHKARRAIESGHL